LRIKDFEFNLRELAGSMGDFGTLFPLAVGYFAVNGMNPSGLLVMLGIANVITGIIYRLPMPLQPMKVIAVVAITQKWPTSRIYATGVVTGVIWLVLSLTGLIQKLAKVTPRSIVRGIQIALGIMLAIEGFKMISTGWILGAISIVVVLILRTNKYAPAAIVLIVLGIAIMGFQGELLGILRPGFDIPNITLFKPIEMWEGLVLAGFAQLPLTATNAIIATSSLLNEYFPSRPVSERKLALNTGIMNITMPFFGGMPMCHGAGGLAGQYYFGARTGGTNILEGVIEISLGLFLASSISTLFTIFPQSIIGAMMFLAGFQLTKFARDIKKGEIALILITVGLSLLVNMAIAFVSAMVIYHVLRRWKATAKYIS
jgi:MFS superfamily sulfate permease-like transporter